MKDGCAPQGQCGCCTVLVDGAPRVACVTPLRRMNGRRITTAEGLDEQRRRAWADAFVATGASQCGFCTPGIICRLEGLSLRGGDLADDTAVGRALQAHLCRCTGWSTIRDAAVAVEVGVPVDRDRDLGLASQRAGIEGRSAQRVGPDVALGLGGFADDIAPEGALVAVPNASGDGWVVGESIFEARSQVEKTQGRRTTLSSDPPIGLPVGDWVVALRTSWVEPAYLEPDAAWCEPGGEPVGPLLNGGAFGGKVDSGLGTIARRLADEHQRPIRIVTDREWVVQNGPKRPPMAAGIRADGTGVVWVARTSGIAAVIALRAPLLDVEEIDVPGPPTSASVRAAGWAEVELLNAGLRGSVDEIRSPDGGSAFAEIDGGTVRVTVRAGDVLDEVVLRSYVMGAAHMALGWVRSESIVVDAEGVVHDLTVRSFGVLRAVDTPRVEVEIDPTPGRPVNASDAVFAAVAAAAWLEAGMPEILPAASPGSEYIGAFS